MPSFAFPLRFTGLRILFFTLLVLSSRRASLTVDLVGGVGSFNGTTSLLLVAGL